jgi:hypothetical protein
VISADVITRVKREIELGMPRVEVERALRIAGLEQWEVEEVFRALRAEGHPVPAAVPPPPEPPQTAPPLVPKPQATKKVTKMPSIPLEVVQAPPTAPEVDLKVPANPNIAKATPPTTPPTKAADAMPATPPPAAAPSSVKASTVMPKAPPGPVTTPTPAQAIIMPSQPVLSAPVKAFVKPPKRSHFRALVWTLFSVVVIAGASVGGAYYYINIFQAPQEPQIYNKPLPLSSLPEASSTSAAASTNTIATSSVPVIATTSAQTSTIDTSHWKTYSFSNTQRQFAFQYPQDWKLDDKMSSYGGPITLTSGKTIKGGNLPDGQIGIEPRLDKSCLDNGTSVVVGGEKELLLDWTEPGGKTSATLKEICILQWDGFTIHFSAHSTSTEQVEDAIMSSFRFQAQSSTKQ